METQTIIYDEDGYTVLQGNHRSIKPRGWLATIVLAGITHSEALIYAKEKSDLWGKQ